MRDVGGTSQPLLGVRIARAIGTRSSNPPVVIRPTRRPVRDAIVLVTAVVPRPNRETVGSSASRVVPERSATSRHASSTPRPSSPGVLGALARQVLVPSESTTSVNVPPTSTPMHVTAVSFRGLVIGNLALFQPVRLC